MKKILLFFFMLVFTMSLYAQRTYTMQENTIHKYFEIDRSEMSINMDQYSDGFLKEKFKNHPRVDNAEFIGTTFVIYFPKTENNVYIENFFWDYF